MNNALSTTVLDDLEAELGGSLVRPGDPEWDAARQPWHLDVDQHPAVVVVAASAQDVVATVNHARCAGLRVAPQSTGHGAGPLGDLGGTVLLKLNALRGVDVDPVRRTARVEAGAQWQDVTPLAAKHGLSALAGSAAGVGVAGYTLGGGLSWLARSHGLAANSLLSLEVVTADGQPRRIGPDNDPDLFWALRGGSGSFGIVTALQFKLYPISQVYAGTLFFPLERTAEVLHTWRGWVRRVPEAVTSIGRVLRFPPLPDLPPHLAGHSYVVVEAACQLVPEDADRWLAPLRALGPTFDTFATIPVTDLTQLHMDPPGPTPARGDGALITTLPAEAIDAVVRVAGPDSDSRLISLELRHLGGMLEPGRMDGGAVSGIDAQFLMFAVGGTPTPESVELVEDAVTAAQDALAPWTHGYYSNFAGRPKPGTTLFGPSYQRLTEIKSAYDPTDLFQSNHPVLPAPSRAS